ncbi:C39 family peptidase [Streptomyces sp. CA-111067]|uniref:C39 family peptidase n=1 Tax=Streptomyces sp. CA-111067 TaxID=3240046 RepID=UPI003D9532D1
MTPPAVIHPVPYYAQWESADLVPRIIAGELDAREDPLWQKSGAASAEEYAFWSWRLCGVACLRMALDHWGQPVPPALAVAEECVAAGAYVRRGDRVDGLIYAPFAEYVSARWPLRAESRPELPAPEVREAVTAGALVMLSVHPSIRDLPRTPPTRGGHLVLAVGVTAEALIIHNPSGFPPHTQRFAEIPWPALPRFYAARGIILSEWSQTVK